MVARNASAVSGPTPGPPISRRQTGSSRTTARIRLVSRASSRLMTSTTASSGSATAARTGAPPASPPTPPARPPPRGGPLAGGPAGLEPGLAQQRPQAVLDVAHLVQHQPACRQQGAPGAAGRALHVHGPEPAGADDLRDRPRVVPVGLVRHGAHRRLGVAGLDAHRGQAR